MTTQTKAAPGELTIRALTPETWDAFADLAERHNGVWGGCWCTWFHPPCAERGKSAEGNRALKEQWVREGRAHAALVFDGEVAVGWCEYGTPEELPRIYHRKEYEEGLERLPDHRLTCFFIDPRADCQQARAVTQTDPQQADRRPARRPPRALPGWCGCRNRG